ncbi:hypothetical protein BDD43_3498 [Mucilaginibacter gracilis]|uniref:Adenylosuccinate lyase n=1 Tax=Mucilaginibacter gracilis TaxID=423350 RepID=A0A495J4N1_9SPHI|nr:hypothetical protein [Mucilaginibacter gracilis]RKR83294.1 hypothetical protein BDD43_3498 [Mucilaginibacter gracilis]
METIKDKDELLLHISETIGKSKVLKLTDILHNRQFDITDLIELTFTRQREIAFRAAWILENLLLSTPTKFVNHLEYIIAQFPEVKNKSCQRHYAKIIMHLTRPDADKAVKQKLDAINMEAIVERCFDLLIEPKTPAAVKAFASEILFNMRLRYTWIGAVLSEQLQIMMPGGKPSIQAKGRRLLSYLQQGE